MMRTPCFGAFMLSSNPLTRVHLIETSIDLVIKSPLSNQLTVRILNLSYSYHFLHAQRTSVILPRVQPLVRTTQPSFVLLLLEK